MCELIVLVLDLVCLLLVCLGAFGGWCLWLFIWLVCTVLFDLGVCFLFCFECCLICLLVLLCFGYCMLMVCVCMWWVSGCLLGFGVVAVCCFFIVFMFDDEFCGAFDLVVLLFAVFLIVV